MGYNAGYVDYTEVTTGQATVQQASVTPGPDEKKIVRYAAILVGIALALLVAGRLGIRTVRVA